MKQVTIIGGGISGLATALALIDEASRRRVDVLVHVLEAAPRVGGNIRSIQEHGFTVESGPNGFLDSEPATLRLVERIGLQSEVIKARQASAKRYIYRAGKLRLAPSNPLRFILSDIMTLPGRMRVLLEPFIRKQPKGDETVFDFAARRIGREAARVLISAMVAGVYAGDARALSLQSTFPKMREMEDRHGSLVKAMLARMAERRRASKRGGETTAGSPAGPSGTLTSFSGGFESLIHGLRKSLPADSISMSHQVTSVTRTQDGRFQLSLLAGEAGSSPCDGFSAHVCEPDALIVTVPAHSACGILEPLDSALTSLLKGIAFAPVAVVALGFNPGSLTRTPDGFGFLVPPGEGPRILGCLFDHAIFASRAPRGGALLRCILAGARDPEMYHLDDDGLFMLVKRELSTCLGLEHQPDHVWRFRYPTGIAQYTIGHAERLQTIDERLAHHPGLFLAGASYRGVAVNACTKEAEATAKAVVTYLCGKSAAA